MLFIQNSIKAWCYRTTLLFYLNGTPLSIEKGTYAQNLGTYGAEKLKKWVPISSKIPKSGYLFLKTWVPMSLGIRTTTGLRGSLQIVYKLVYKIQSTLGLE